jgi:uncharacterized protein YdaU (DUF1376 family)
MKHPWMPMFWGDFFANTLDLSAQELGAYICLIAHAWERGGSFDVSSSRLRRIARVNSFHWPRVWRRLSPFFEIEKLGDRMTATHRRVLIELAKADGISKQRKHAAQQMQSKRKAFAKQAHMRNHMQNGGNHQVSIDPSSFPTAARKEITKTSDQQTPSERATALPEGAPARLADNELEERKRAIQAKPPEERSLTEINFLMYGKWL